jgi:ribosomal protein L32
MLSFHKIMEHMEVYREGKTDKTDKKSSEAIRAGLNIREDFWDDFMLLINNSAALAELLNVPATRVSSWRSRVQRYLDQVKAEDDVPDPKKRARMIRAEKDPFDFDR